MDQQTSFTKSQGSIKYQSTNRQPIQTTTRKGDKT
jgi:hypothetical protein